MKKSIRILQSSVDDVGSIMRPIQEDSVPLIWRKKPVDEIFNTLSDTEVSEAPYGVRRCLTTTRTAFSGTQQESSSYDAVKLRSLSGDEQADDFRQNGG